MMTLTSFNVFPLLGFLFFTQVRASTASSFLSDANQLDGLQFRTTVCDLGFMPFLDTWV